MTSDNDTNNDFDYDKDNISMAMIMIGTPADDHKDNKCPAFRLSSIATNYPIGLAIVLV